MRVEDVIKDVVKKGRVFDDDRDVLIPLIHKIRQYFNFLYIPNHVKKDVFFEICRDGKAIIIGYGKTRLYNGTICLTPSGLIMKIPTLGNTIQLNEIISVSRLLTILYNIDTIIEIYRKGIEIVRKIRLTLNQYKEAYINNLEKKREKLYNTLTNSI